MPTRCSKQAGSPEGSTPSGRRYGGCASIHYSSSLSTLPGRKGARGMVRSRTTVRASGESRGEPPLWQVVWRMCLHKLLFFTSPFLEGRGARGMVRSRTTVRTSGESRGEHPHWQAEWRMCLHTLHFFTFPPSWKEGGQGDGVVPHYGACKRGVQRGAPLWQEVWRMCLHTLLFFTFPPSWKEGGQGDGAVPHYGAYKRGSPEGSTPTGRRSGGCASINDTSLLSPFLEGRGSGGWCGPALRSVQAGECRGEHPHWQATWDTKIQ